MYSNFIYVTWFADESGLKTQDFEMLRLIRMLPLVSQTKFYGLKGVSKVFFYPIEPQTDILKNL